MTASIAFGLVLGGALGAPARYLLDAFVQDRTRTLAPWGTFVVNVTGSFAMGLVAGAALHHGLPETPEVWLGSGFCGSYTTFSTFTFETVRLLEDRAIARASVNGLGSVLVGGAAAAAGLALTAAI